ncbi:hypothetical protein [Fictibacillus terranigra]|uniref:Transposase n=1 Tax=Fictibacillus terranigra TaxID=3058424 RepID=A0ABT8E1G1_9BACL|nr:hypothetical protein [Fictibacillus sp. CENA-BCM004]MDN4071744.1 hypothetical protein [Fictibacillus sp. CENA-BCM004]
MPNKKTATQNRYHKLVNDDDWRWVENIINRSSNPVFQWFRVTAY